MIHQTYNGHVDSFQPEQMRDFMDVYIQQIKEAKEAKPISFYFFTVVLFEASFNLKWLFFVF